MGQTCSPKKIDDSNGSQRKDTDLKNDAEQVQRHEKFSEIITAYQEDNEKLKRELIKRSEQNTVAQQEATHQNEKIMEELAAMRALVEEKNRALVKHQLEAALHSKATAMVTSESVSKLLKEGTLEKITRSRIGKSVKEKWVQVEMHTCQNTKNGFERGYVLLIYSDSKNFQVSTRCKIISVDGDGTADVGDKYKGRNFLVQAIVGRENKAIVFGCVDEEMKKEWVGALNRGLLQIDEEEKEMNKPLFLKVEFSKEKLGIRVEENVLKSKQNNLKEEEKVATERSDVSEVEQKAETTKGADTEGDSCELVVKKITDNDLYKAGLVLDSIIIAINDTHIRGMSYDKQVGFLTSTEKPFTLSFSTGPEYLATKVGQTTAYPEILKELLANDDNAVKTAFDELIKGTPFEMELNASNDKVTAIAELLSNQRRLTAMLQNVTVQQAEL